MQLSSIKNLSNELILENLKRLKSNEDKTIADFVLYLSELDSRKLYRDSGFSSLFTYCTEGLGYSAGAAYSRVQAAKSLKDNPEIYGLLRDGKLTLCAVSEISKVLKPENKAELIQSSQGKSKAEVQKITVKYQEAKPIKKEKITPKKVIIENKEPLFSQDSSAQIKTSYRFSVEVDDDFMQVLNEAKAFTGHVPMVEILKRTLKEFVNRRKTAPRKVNTTAPKVSSISRYIPKSVAYEVRNHGQHRCSFVSSDGRRCSETCGLEIDHIKPFSLGGSNEASNLRLLCPAHNLLFAERTFGKEKINNHIHTER